MHVLLFSYTDVSDDNTTLSFSPAVEFEHISISQVVDGILVETRGEVGLLTHNVKIRGSVHEDWVEEVEACPDEFDTSKMQFKTFIDFDEVDSIWFIKLHIDCSGL